MLRELTVEVKDDQTMRPQQMGNGPVPSKGSHFQIGNHIGSTVAGESPLEKDNVSGLSQMFGLQEALKQGIASTKQQLRKTSEALDGMIRYLPSFTLPSIRASRLLLCLYRLLMSKTQCPNALCCSVIGRHIYDQNSS